jgi:hypothetical protein
MTMSSDEQRLWRLEQRQRAQWDLQWGLTDDLIKARRELALDVDKMSIDQLKVTCRGVYKMAGAEPVFDLCLARLACLVSEAEFTAFYQSLEAPP